ncbi:MAG: DUF1499 domain-containing protein [Pirellulales bacterium]
MGQIASWVGLVIGGLVALGFLSLVVRNLLATRPRTLGVVDGRLRPCPATPNCVCTQDTDAEHAIAPLKFSGTPAEAVTRLKAALATLPRTSIVAERSDYLHVEFTTRLMRYVDDVEFLVDAAGKVIHFRSASRIGYSDLGTNRRRMEAVRAAYESRP